MHNTLKILALGAALAAAPAAAQLNVGLGGNAGGGLAGGLGGSGANVGGFGNVGVGGNVGIGTRGTIEGVTGRVDQGVNRVDGFANGALAGVNQDLQLATAADLTGGATVRDENGRKIGTVQSVQGNMALIVKGDQQLQVPVASLYRGARGLVAGLTDAQLNAAVSANASANAGAGAGARN